VLVQVGFVHLEEVLSIYKSCVRQHQKLGFNQWDDDYPNQEIVVTDIENKQLFGVENDGRLVAVVALTDDEPKEYKVLNWTCNKNYKVVHRLGVQEHYTGKGFAKLLAYLWSHNS